MAARRIPTQTANKAEDHSFPHVTDLSAFNPWEFLFEGEPVRIIARDDGPWFVAADVCRVLSIANGPQGIARLECGNLHLLDTAGARGKREVWALDEAALYELIFTSRKARAKAFRKWVLSEVIPQIRRTGRYTPEGSQAAIEQATPSGATDATGAGLDPSKTYAEIRPLDPEWGQVRPSWFLDSSPLTLTVPGSGRFVVDVWPGHPPRVRMIPEDNFWESFDVQLQRSQLSIVLGSLQTISGLWLNYRVSSNSESDPGSRFAIDDLDRVIIQAGDLAERLTQRMSSLAPKRTAPTP